MNLEQLTFRVDIEPRHRAVFVHFIEVEEGVFSIKIGDLVMSIGEFREYVKQLKEIEYKMVVIENFIRSANA
jgi:hypothetical protein